MLTLICLMAAPVICRADEGTDFFEKKIRPLLVTHCYECHSSDSKKLGGNLLLDHKDGWIKGGDTSSAIDPGNPEKSLLLTAVKYEDDGLKMPPKGKLPAAAIADLEAWIKMGAPDPRLEKPKTKPVASWEEVFRSRSHWWSLQSVKKSAVPTPKNAAWSEHPVDRFVLAKLDERGLAPANRAEPRTLIRRLSLVLTGLPPTPDQVVAFVQEYEETTKSAIPQAAVEKVIEKLVDSLMASPHFGERWARHWQDVVRFSETHGNEWNYEVHHAWRYRDYLIRAFNNDLPYDQFIREHIAGDLLPPRWNKEEQINEAVIGTGFYRFGEVNHDDCISLRSIGYDLLDNQIDTLTKAFQATTVACARCHDHKLDAISTQDYYALLGILRSSRLVSQTIDAPETNGALTQQLTSLKTEIRKELAAAWMQDAKEISRYLLAAQAKRANRPDAAELAKGLDPQRLEKWVAALAIEKAPQEDGLEPWRIVAASGAAEGDAFKEQWRKLVDKYMVEDKRRTEFNQKDIVSFADFRTGEAPGWQVGGQALRHGPGKCGDFMLHADGGALVKAILPAGSFSGALSEKLNGTLRSPVIPPGKKNISFQVMGQRSSAVRLVSNSCQLNYKNYRALISANPFPQLEWITFQPPEDRESLRTYAELMTMLDNPKFPDQLSALGGDKDNYRLPWEKAAENPRSWFGVTRVVLHDGELPKAELSHLRPLLAANEPASLVDVAAHYAAVVETVLRNWSEDKATDDDVRWLDMLLRRGLVRNQTALSPRLEELTKQYRQVESQLAVPRIAAGIAESGSPYNQPVFVRGDCERMGEAAPRRYLEVLAKSTMPFQAAGSGRLELAQRIASAENPLTARVMVNRVWHHLFGTGIVRTVDDFGHVGDLPSHPELLDFLATEFVDDGWSVKRLIRRLVLSRTFQLASAPTAAAKEKDPQNRLLSHYPARRMEAEAIRDSILATSGRLDLKLFGMSVQPFREKEYVDRRLFPGPLDGNGRRSIYIKNNLMEGPKFLEAFNFPGGKVTQGRRDVTNVPAQALALLNDPFVLQQADLWAAKLIAEPHNSSGERIAAMFETSLSRPPTDEERQRFEAMASELATLNQVPTEEILKRQVVWKDIAHAMFNLKEFIYIP
ncbi:MAG: PSD1 and planctomycete cytochrome C domain-containing protein [Pirellulaceae bacterium]